MIKFCFTFLFLSLCFISSGQTSWKLRKDKHGIKVYQSDGVNSNFKNLKAVSTFEGTLDKFHAVLTNFDQYKNWIYNTKTSYLVKAVSSTELYYYSEVALPWPFNNRDAVSLMKIERDKNNQFIKITETSVPNYLPAKPDKVRVPKSNVTWMAKVVSPSTIHVTYTLEADPGGELPAWVVNTFADKGPYESFKNLKELLKKK